MLCVLAIILLLLLLIVFVHHALLVVATYSLLQVLACACSISCCSAAALLPLDTSARQDGMLCAFNGSTYILFSVAQTQECRTHSPTASLCCCVGVTIAPPGKAHCRMTGQHVFIAAVIGADDRLRDASYVPEFQACYIAACHFAGQDSYTRPCISHYVASIPVETSASKGGAA